MAITFHLYFKINNLRHYVILLVKVIETSETWNREKLQHDGNLNALKQLFLFFSPFWNRSRSFLDRIEPSAKALVFHPDGNRYAIILFEGQPLRPPRNAFWKTLSSSYLHLVWVKASDFSRSARTIQQIFDLLVHLFERWARLIAMDNPIYFSNDLLYLIADKENANSTAFASRRLLDFSRRSIISFSSDSWNSG